MRPSLKEVKEHFKDALEIECLSDGVLVNVNDFTDEGIHEYNGDYWANYTKPSDNSILLWSESLGNKYAKITKYKTDSTSSYNRPDFKKITSSIASLLEYKNNKYGNAALEPINIFTGKSKVGHKVDDKLSRIKNSSTLSKNDVADTIGYLILVCEENGWDNFDEFKEQSDLKELEVIEPETVKAGLEVGKWYTNGNSLLGCYTSNDSCYGFHNNIYRDEWSMSYPEYSQATDEEVKAALIKEAQSRYKVGDEVVCLYSGEVKELRNLEVFENFSNSNSVLWSDRSNPSNTQIFNNGKWASHA